jgi:hypothetical protein
MSDAIEPTTDPQPDPPSDADAWAKACEEDLAAERARRRASAGPGDAVSEELRRLLGTVAEQAGRLGTLAGGVAVGMTAEGLVERARTALDPVLDRNTEVIDHLARAGDEMIAACRAAFIPQQQQSSETTASEERDTGDLGDSGGKRDDQA